MQPIDECLMALAGEMRFLSWIRYGELSSSEFKLASGRRN